MSKDKIMKNTLSFYLFSHPSFKEGVGRIWDFSQCLNTYSSSETEDEADARAIFVDWVMVGKDMKQAVKNFENESEPITVK